MPEVKKQTIVWVEDSPNDVELIKEQLERGKLSDRVNLEFLMVEPGGVNFKEILERVTNLDPEVTVFTDGLKAAMPEVVKAARKNVPERRVGFVTDNLRSQVELAIDAYKVDFFNKGGIIDKKSFKKFVLGEK